ncbi:MAG: hypothetical protein J6112_06575 [Clostridia bacterium]|nr:hypothetical protein [Clostridia bacterium]
MKQQGSENRNDPTPYGGVRDEDFYIYDVDSIDSYEDFPDDTYPDGGAEPEDYTYGTGRGVSENDAPAQERSNKTRASGRSSSRSAAADEPSDRGGSERPLRRREKAETEDEEEPVSAADTKTPAGKKSVFGAVIGALVLILIIVLCFFAARRGRRDTVYYYIEGGELYRSNDSGRGFKITSAFIAGDVSANPAAVELLADSLLAEVFESSDGKYVFYPDNNSVTGEKGSFYCRRTDGTGKVIRVDSSVSDVTPASDSSVILYRNGSSLCRFSPSSGPLVICLNVKDYLASDSLETVYCTDPEGSLFVCDAAGNTELVEREVTSLGCVNDSGTVWFVKNRVLYRKPLNSDKVKICSDAYADGFVKKGKTPGFYFLTFKTVSIPVSSLVSDSFLEKDAALTEPREPVEPDRSSYPTAKEYNAAYALYESELAAYPGAVEAYKAKTVRDKIRSAAASGEYLRCDITLNYCDGENVTPVAERIAADKGLPGYASDGSGSSGTTDLFGWPVDNGAGGIVYFKKKDSPLPSFAIENYESYEALLETVNDALEPSCVFEAAYGTSRLYYETDEVYSVSYSANGKYFYYFTNLTLNSEDDSLYELHRIDIKSKKDETVDTKVSDRYFDPDACMYLKEPRAGFSYAFLCVNGKRVAEKVLPGSARAAGNTVCFLSDYSGDTGVFSVYNGKKIVFSAAGVRSFVLTESGTPVFIGEYHGPGDNVLFYGTGSKEVVRNVSGVR